MENQILAVLCTADCVNDKKFMLTLAVCDSLKLIMHSFRKQTISWFRVGPSYHVMAWHGMEIF
jgi:hypothetical protein